MAYKRKVLILYLLLFVGLLLFSSIINVVIERNGVSVSFFQFQLTYIFQIIAFTSIAEAIIAIVILTGMILPIVASIIEERIKPYVFVSLLFMIAYNFLGLMFYGIRNGEG